MKTKAKVSAVAEPTALVDDGHDHEPQIIYGTNQPETIVTGGGPQQIFALNGNDIVRAGGGPDIVHAGNGDDAIYAQGGPDSVNGDNGDDYLHGGGGPDTMFGGNGDDILIGCMAADILTGGRGEDIFVYRSASEAPAHGEGDDHEDPDDGGAGGHDGGAGGHDGNGCGDDHEEPGQETITDFTPGADSIDFSAIGTITGISVGATKNSVWFEQEGDDTMLYLDTNGSVDGDNPAEMAVLLLDVDAQSLTIDDFILVGNGHNSIEQHSTGAFEAFA